MSKNKDTQKSNQESQGLPKNSQSPKHPQPQILLIDLPDQAESALKGAGYNVSMGSFGNPYRVTQEDGLTPVITDGALPKNHTEQDIVIIDLAARTILEQPSKEKHTPLGEDDWWVSCKRGVVDPRPRLMAWARSDFDRILAHGGVFIIFAEERFDQEFEFGRVVHGAFRKNRDIPFDNWCFLSILNDIIVNGDRGKEIIPISVDHPLVHLLSQHATNSYFSCTFQHRYQSGKNPWLSLANNKFGSSVAGMLPPNEESKGRLFIFPQLSDKPQFLVSFITNVLPGLEPQLFPYSEVASWTQHLEYEVPIILELRSRIDELQEQVKTQVAELEKTIEKERIEHGYLHSILTDSGAPLVASVRKALEVLGFHQIIDADEEMLKQGKTGPKREDLQIHGSSPLVLVEVKGISGLPREASALQVWKYIAPRMRELNRTDIRGLSIINHQRHIPALDRENRLPFSEDILINAEDQQFGLLTTWDLFKLARNYLRHGWKHEQIRNLFFANGRIEPVPGHYEFFGTVEEFWEKVGAVGVKVEVGQLKQGDRIAFELAVDFEEQDVESLQVNRTAVVVAEEGMLAGILTQFSKAQLKKGLRVFRLSRSSLLKPD